MAEASANDPVFFWHAEGENGHFGQWYYAPWEHAGIRYETAEMWMMVQKAKLFKDEVHFSCSTSSRKYSQHFMQDIASQMAATTDPKTHKALGRKVRSFDGKIWDQHKLRIVEEGNYWKFTVSEDAANLKQLLLDTGDREIVEVRIVYFTVYAANDG